MSDERLAEYRRRRTKPTPEPRGDAPTPPSERHRFVIQQHDATRLHWDLRLEHDGVAVSWALPRLVPLDSSQNRLAVHTEDHPIEYLDFEGDIPAGSYGAGHMQVYDRGTYELVSWKDKKVVVRLHGERVRGQFALFETRGRDWMIHRMDPPEEPERQPVPADLRPMLAVSRQRRPSGANLAWEIRWSGMRVLISAEPGHVVITDADGSPVTSSFPDVARIGRATGPIEVILDGVIVEDETGSLRRRLAAARSSISRVAKSAPLRAALFDVIWRDGRPLWDEPWEERRQELEALGLDGPAWFTPSAHVGDGAAIMAAAADRGIGALIAKRLSSRYRCGTTSKDWIELAL